ncbi:hypothetical protein N825_24820 [Skermanella stibiiresistens SB22]|uniref:Uncharacterized protein n=1 Tax=Skermanella stibiiresistens SB22 TaxID=1385369 RepID=W9H744_9PROT|nr:hypothetical protein N825_24820 [Skermanella stibiiresistens SB22]
MRLHANMNGFLNVEPKTENRWRAIILFGRNAASFKFALRELEAL